jgi:hypothetical protein
VEKSFSKEILLVQVILREKQAHKKEVNTSNQISENLNSSSRLLSKVCTWMFENIKILFKLDTITIG